MRGSFIGRDVNGQPYGVKNDDRCYGARVALIDKPVYIWVPYKSRRYRLLYIGRWMLRLYPKEGRTPHVLLPHAHARTVN